MAKDFNFDFSQFEKFAESWQKTYDDFEPFLKRFLLQQAQRVVVQAKQNTPVGTPESTGKPGYVGGTLRSMWGIGSQKLIIATNLATREVEQVRGKHGTTRATIEDVKVNGKNLEVTIFNGMDYATFIEYGHRLVNGKWQEGRFMLTVSIDDVTKKMPARFQKAWKEFLIKKGAV